MWVTVLPMGEAGLLVEVTDLEAVLALDSILRTAVGAGRLPRMVDQVPGARTVLLRPEAGTDLHRLRQQVETLCGAVDSGAAADSNAAADSGAAADTSAVERADPQDHPVVVIPVAYDGPDIAEVATLTGMSVEEVIAMHTRSHWRYAFGGFAPGFGYLVGGDRRLQVPRRARPRTSISAGAVGLAGEFSGVYPRSSPGGWQLIGRTEAVMWDVNRDPPALLRPGVLVQFRNAGGRRG